MAGCMYDWLQRVWYGGGWGGALLAPLSWLYRSAVSLRRLLYRTRLLAIHDVGVPVIVVGNITTGGTGKTPLTLWLARALHEKGLRTGIVLRGYGGSRREPQLVERTARAADVGDEAVLLARRAPGPVAIGADRVAAARLLVAQGVQAIVSDDGLQHLRLGRSFEIAVIDGARGLGNGHLLPAGPLREPAKRLRSVDAIAIHGDGAVPDAATGVPVCRLSLRADSVRSLATGETKPLETFRGARVHAIAGIGHPERFFALLRRHGLDPIAHPWPDHRPLADADLRFGDGAAVLMTEKDAVKARDWDTRALWEVPVEAELDAEGARALLTRIEARLKQRADSSARG